MNYTLVGAFVIVLSAALTAAVLWLASGGALRKHYDLYMAMEEESVAGLNLNAPVKYNGVDVGKVRAIRLDPANPERVWLTLAIERGTPIKVDTLAVLKVQGLTGIAYMELSGGARNALPLLATAHPPYPVIRTKPSLSARLETVLSGVLVKVDRMSSNVDAVFSAENRAAFTRILADLAAVSHTVALRKDTLDAGIQSAARTFHNTAQATESLAPLIARVGRAAEAVEQVGHAATLASSKAGKTFATVDANVQRLAADLGPELQNLLTELNTLTLSLRKLSEQTQRNPAGLLLGGSPLVEGPGEVSGAAQSSQ